MIDFIFFKWSKLQAFLYQFIKQTPHPQTRISTTVKGIHLRIFLILSHICHIRLNGNLSSKPAVSSSCPHDDASVHPKAPAASHPVRGALVGGQRPSAPPASCGTFQPARVLSGGAGLPEQGGVQSAGLSGGGGLGSAHTHLLPLPEPQLPACHPGRLLSRRRYGLRGLWRDATYNLIHQQLQQCHRWVINNHTFIENHIHRPAVYRKNYIKKKRLIIFCIKKVKPVLWPLRFFPL